MVVKKASGRCGTRRPRGTVLDRARYKAALVDAIRRYDGDFHVVAQLPPGRSRAALEDALYHWVARVDRHYLGRAWAKFHRKADRMRGVIFFEKGGGEDHAHLIVTVPRGASKLHFQFHARWFFQQHPVRTLRAVYRKAVTNRGTMWLRRIEQADSDRSRVASYVLKGLETEAEHCVWKFLDQLAPLQVG